MKSRFGAVFLAAAFIIICGQFITTNANLDNSAASIIALNVDATEAPRKLFHTRMSMPATPGPMTLVYPKWIPGEHGPTGPIINLAGLKITAGGKTISWRRDDVDMYAVHLEVPSAGQEISVAFGFILAS